VLHNPPKHDFGLTDADVADLSQFLVQLVNGTLRSGPSSHPIISLQTGDASAGRTFFEGSGGCSGCHSPTGDLAGIGKKYDPATLQQKIVFPNSSGFRGRGAPASTSPHVDTKVTVTPPGEPAVTGVLIRQDDFNVTIRDAVGNYRTFARVRGVKVEVTDPYAAHEALLDKITDEEMHNVAAYLETLK
jgi:cytochrome c553